ncbi:hypothetical protein [Roseovarius sp. EL26]|uniref:hypothetical protein n=1 Tax=Roseovarius sp. EL26 TaxID=2126672 RepID=UPI000EA2A654|nr:hypothetical protein [Roseovarius sp. EL26]
MVHINPDFISQERKALIACAKSPRADRLKAMELIVDEAYLHVIHEQDADQLIKYLVHETEDEALWDMYEDDTLDDVQCDLIKESLIKRALSRRLLSGWGPPQFCTVSACSRYCADEDDKSGHGCLRCRYHWDCE